MKQPTKKTKNEPKHEARFRLHIDYDSTFEALRSGGFNPIQNGGRGEAGAQITVWFNQQLKKKDSEDKQIVGSVIGVFCPLHRNVADIYKICQKCGSFQSLNPETSTIKCAHSDVPLLYTLSDVWLVVPELGKFNALISNTLLQIYFEQQEDLPSAIWQLQPFIIDAESHKPVENLAAKMEYIPLTKREADDMRKALMVTDLKMMYQLEENRMLTAIFLSLVSELRSLDDSGIQDKIKPILKRATDLFSKLNA